MFFLTGSRISSEDPKGRIREHDEENNLYPLTFGDDGGKFCVGTSVAVLVVVAVPMSVQPVAELSWPTKLP